MFIQLTLTYASIAELAKMLALQDPSLQTNKNYTKCLHSRPLTGFYYWIIMKRTVICVLAAVLALVSCTQEPLTKSGLSAKKFQSKSNDKETALYVLTNEKGMEVCVTNVGARIVSIMAPDKTGEFRDVVLGFDNVKDYLTKDSNFGATIGRYGNRIANGQFTLDGKTYQLPQNDGQNCLHGGPNGWHTVIFDVDEADESHIRLSYLSPDGEAGFPGNVKYAVTYTLNKFNELKIEYEAETDAPTVINPTNHSYFNLDGDPANSVCESYDLIIDADYFTPTDENLIPTGEIVPVDDTPMDFRMMRDISTSIDDNSFTPIAYGHGYDHNWVLDTNRDINEAAATALSLNSGIVLKVYTDQPGIQVYCGNFLDGTVKGKHGIVYPHRSAICLETQHFPDSPNHPEFPSTVLRPGEKFESTTIYAFSIIK